MSRTPALAPLSAATTAMGLAPMRHLYLHVPFCMKRCSYCAFYLIEHGTRLERQGYLERLDAELAERAPAMGPLDSIYLGGGTPTYLGLRQLGKLLASIARHTRLAPGCEFGTEGNPETYTRERLDLLVAAGVRRFSVGLQSFSERTRRALGRPGKPRCFGLALDNLRAVGAGSINLDLIYGVPGQTLADWEADLRQALALAPDHVSTYALSVEPGTPLARAGGREGEVDTVVDMWRMAGDLLGAAGLPRYEVSNYAKPAHRCRHNLHVWHGGSFAGAGPAACWYDGRSRWSNPADLERWMAGETPTEDALSPADRAVEILIVGLRLVAGWQRAEFQAITGYDYQALRGEELARLADDGLLAITDTGIHLTERGLLLADYAGTRLL